LRKSGGSKEKDIHSYYAMVWASLAAKKQQQKLEIEKKEEYMVIFFII